MKRFIAAALLLCLAAAPAIAADTLRIGLQKTGTASWEIDLIRARGLDKAADLDIQTIDLASPEAGKIALQGGSADLIVSDWLWAMRERSLGDKLLFSPYSSALGALMTPKDSPIHELADLAGRSVGVAGGPLDKSWLMLQAAAKKQGVDLSGAKAAFGAPPLIAEKFAQGETDSALEFWNFCADLESRGFTRAIEMTEVEKLLGAKGPVAMTGYVFSEDFASGHKPALKRFFDAIAKARAIYGKDAAAWAPIKARLKIADDATLDVYRKRYLDGAPHRPIAEEAADAKALYAAMAEIGGKALVGEAPTLDAEMYFDPAGGL
jgi:NitT/TauT family transport system substrate-binding protein